MYKKLWKSIFLSTSFLVHFLIVSIIFATVSSLAWFLLPNDLFSFLNNLLVIITIPLLAIITYFIKKYFRPLMQIVSSLEQIAISKSENSEVLENKVEKEFFISLNEKLQSLLDEKMELYRKEEFLRKIIDLSPNYIYAIDENGRITYVNQAMAILYGKTPESFIGKQEAELVLDQQQVEQIVQETQFVLDNLQQLFIPEQVIQYKDGEEVWVQTFKRPIPLPTGNQVLVISTDITERKNKEKEVEYQAQHDSLTNLPNRILFHKRLLLTLDEAKGNESQVAVMFLDLDGFKNINDSLGHSIGDHLLQLVAKRLNNCIRHGDTIARMGGDEFTVILPKVTSKNDVQVVAHRMIESLKEPFKIDQHELHITTSIGISIYPVDGENAEMIIKNADTAMYYAKENGKNHYQIYIPEMSVISLERLKIESNLRKALLNNEFYLHYQPKIDSDKGLITGLEALLRWNNPSLGIVPPDKFIPIAEENGLILEIGEWVLREACRQLQTWHEKGYRTLRVAVNVSIRQITDINFKEQVDSILEEVGMEAKWLELEITESTLMKNPKEVIDILDALKEKGIQISIDDFGTGYSSLNYLKRFPVHTLKIDRSFIKELSTSQDDQSIIKSIVAMAHNLNLKVIAEGVETEEQFIFLRAIGCNEIQGYFISKPEPVEQIQIFLSSSKSIKKKVQNIALKQLASNVFSILKKN